MDSSKINFICPACRIDFGNATNLNKHLIVCEKYDNWIRYYKAPVSVKCKDCNTEFYDLKNHFNCKKS